MFCYKCGKKNLEENKNCYNCGIKLKNNEVEEKKGIKDIIFSNKVMLIMFFINYIIFILSFSVNNYNGDSFFDILYKVFVVSVILGNILALPFHLSSLIVVFMGLNKKSLSYTFIGMIASIIMPLYTCFWHFFLAMGYAGLFTSKVCTLIFIIYSILLFLFCLFKALFRVK